MAARRFVPRANSAGISLKDVRLIVRELTLMAAEGLAITPAAVEDRASKRSCPIHHLFTWNEPKAAYEYRVDQARKLIGCVQEIVVNRKEPVKVYHSLRVSTDSGTRNAYLDRKEVLMDDDALRQISEQRYKALLESCKAIEDLDIHLRDANWKRLIGFIRQHPPKTM